MKKLPWVLMGTFMFAGTAYSELTITKHGWVDSTGSGRYQYYEIRTVGSAKYFKCYFTLEGQVVADATGLSTHGNGVAIGPSSDGVKFDKFYCKDMEGY